VSLKKASRALNKKFVTVSSQNESYVAVWCTLLLCVWQLHIAASNGYMRVLEFLLSHGALVSSVDKYGWQPLHCAICWGQVAAYLLFLSL